jgi:hypothetical protein
MGTAINEDKFIAETIGLQGCPAIALQLPHSSRINTALYFFAFMSSI